MKVVPKHVVLLLSRRTKRTLYGSQNVAIRRYLPKAVRLEG